MNSRFFHLQSFFLSCAILVPFLLSAPQSFASNTILKGAEVSVSSIHMKDRILGLSIVGEDAVGPNYTKTTLFMAAAGVSGKWSDLKKKIKDDKDLKFVLKTDLQLISDEEAKKAKLP